MMDESQPKLSFIVVKLVKFCLLFPIEVYKFIFNWIDHLFIKTIFSSERSELTKISLPIVSRFLDQRRKIVIEKAKFVLCKQDLKPVIPKIFEFKDGHWSIKTITPQLSQSNDYQLKWIEKIYSLDEIRLADDNYIHTNLWQEISTLLRESWQIDRKIIEQRHQIRSYQEKKRLVVTSDLYSRYLHKYEQIITKLENEIETGKNIHRKIHQLIRDYLISIEIGEVSPIDIINALENSKQERKALDADLEDKFNALRFELDAYLDAIDDYSDFMET
jgi:hypothetical protein